MLLWNALFSPGRSKSSFRVNCADPVTQPLNTSQKTKISQNHSKPNIPEYDLVRRIGSGSYGEVWLARTLTGSYRAVKVVRRSDFDSEHTFEREFEGLLKIEPISRKHAGLVDILHVGRNHAEGVYHYVMELGDDREMVQKIHPVDYEPRTLAMDTARKKRFSVDETIHTGLSLGAGLQYLHEHGLTHRDIKPSNVIFVSGEPKLADIGLVAEEGQRTYVGTAGFVPPEGPGTAVADIYSLGMVLYEISTGKDRMSFPALPDDIGLENKDRKRWRMLNEVICKACHPNPNRRFGTAKHLIDALRRVQRGKYNRPILPRVAAITCVASLTGFSLAWAKSGEMPWPPGYEGRYLLDPRVRNLADRARLKDPVVIPAGKGKMTIDSVPQGAGVYIGRVLLGMTPLPKDDLPTGKQAFILKHPGYDNESFEVNIQPGEDNPKSFRLRFSMPSDGKDWTNSLGMNFIWKKDGQRHLSEPVGYLQYQKLIGYDSEDVSGGRALVQKSEASHFCRLLLEEDLAKGRLQRELFHYEPVFSENTTPTPTVTPDMTQVELPGKVTMPVPEAVEENSPAPVAFRVALIRHQFGDLVIGSTPKGATVVLNGKPVGVTPLTLTQQPVGPLSIKLSLAGHEDYLVKNFNVVANKTNTHEPKLKRSKEAILGADYENSLGMRFKHIPGLNALVCVWETRIKDFNRYRQDLGEPAYGDDFDSGTSHPVSSTRDEAMSFCRWLTLQEKKLGRLKEDLEYRLPTDEEWSLAAGIYDRPGLPDPAARNQVLKNRYVWGTGEDAWPPPRGKGLMPGNFSDLSRLGRDRSIGRKELVGGADDSRYPDGKPFDDGFPFLAPVGSFTANPYGLYDLCGNVSEWVSDNYGGRFPKLGVVRGGSWDSFGQGELLASSRNAVPPDLTPDGICGFRCVIALTTGKAPKARPVE